MTPDGTLSRYLSGVEFSPRDLRLALVEASAGKVGTAADQVLLMCYMYDPIDRQIWPRDHDGGSHRRRRHGRRAWDWQFTRCSAASGDRSVRLSA